MHTLFRTLRLLYDYDDKTSGVKLIVPKSRLNSFYNFILDKEPEKTEVDKDTKLTDRSDFVYNFKLTVTYL